MSDAINKIRELLNELEASNPKQADSFRESFQLFELPELVGDIVDYLQQRFCLMRRLFTGIYFATVLLRLVMFSFA